MESALNSQMVDILNEGLREMFLSTYIKGFREEVMVKFSSGVILGKLFDFSKPQFSYLSYGKAFFS